MRTCIVIHNDAKGAAQVAGSGTYDKTKAGAAGLISKLKPSESVWIVASGFPPKIFKGQKGKTEKK